MDAKDIAPIFPATGAFEHEVNRLLRDWQMERESKRMGPPGTDPNSAFLSSVIANAKTLGGLHGFQDIKNPAIWKRVFHPFASCMALNQARKHDVAINRLMDRIRAGQWRISISRSKALIDQLSYIENDKILFLFSGNWNNNVDLRHQISLNDIAHERTRELLENAVHEHLQNLKLLRDSEGPVISEKVHDVAHDLAIVLLDVARFLFRRPRDENLQVFVTLGQILEAANTLRDILLLKDKLASHLRVIPMDEVVKLIRIEFQDWKSQKQQEMVIGVNENTVPSDEIQEVGRSADEILAAEMEQANLDDEHEEVTSDAAVERDLKKLYKIQGHLDENQLIQILEQHLSLKVERLDLSQISELTGVRRGQAAIYHHPVYPTLCLKVIEQDELLFGRDSPSRKNAFIARKCMRILREARNWLIAFHGGDEDTGFIAPLLGVVVDTSHGRHKYPALVTRYRKDKSLWDYIRSHGLDENERLQLLLQAAQTLTFLHDRPKPVVHGDFKSSNFLVIHDNDDVRIQLIDFGSSKVFDDTHGLSTKDKHGTPRTIGFIPPEAILGPYGIKSDMFAFGTLFIEVVYGVRPVFESVFGYDYGYFDTILEKFAFKDEEHKEFVRKFWNSKVEQRPDSRAAEKLLKELLAKA